MKSLIDWLNEPATNWRVMLWISMLLLGSSLARCQTSHPLQAEITQKHEGETEMTQDETRQGGVANDIQYQI